MTIIGIVLGFSIAGTVLLCGYCAALQLMRRSRKRLPQDGLLVLAQWHPHARHLTSMLLMSLLIVPVLTFMCSFVLGGIMAICEGWTYDEGVLYVLQNIAGTAFPLTPVSPETTAGDIMDLLVSIWALLIMATAMGVVGAMQFMAQAVTKMSPTKRGLMKHILGTLTVALLVISAVVGGLIAGVEDWRFKDGLFFIMGKLCGLLTPLTDSEIQTASGHFLEIYTFIIELTIGGAVIGVVAGHPAIAELLELLEGGEGEEAPAEDAKEADLANADNVGPQASAKA